LSSVSTESTSLARDAIIDLGVTCRESPFTIRARTGLRRATGLIVVTLGTVMVLRAEEGVRDDLSIILVGVIASHNLGSLLSGSLVLTEETSVAIGASSRNGKSSSSTVGSGGAGMFTGELCSL
jgi:hypothetical protein